MFPLFSWPFLSVLDLALVLTVIPKVKSSSVKEQEAPVAAVIETAPEKGGDDDGEVRSNNISVSVVLYTFNIPLPFTRKKVSNICFLKF